MQGAASEQIAYTETPSNLRQDVKAGEIVLLAVEALSESDSPHKASPIAAGGAESSQHPGIGRNRAAARTGTLARARKQLRGGWGKVRQAVLSGKVVLLNRVTLHRYGITEEQLTNLRKSRPHLDRALRRRTTKDERDWLQKAEDEIFITMQLIFHAFSPKSIDHSKLFTPIYISILWIIFWYMAGVYFWYVCREYILCSPEDARLECRTLSQSDMEMDFCIETASDLGSFGSKGLVRWIYKTGTQRNFSARYLHLWGGRYLRSMTDSGSGGGGGRWFTSTLLHQSFQHILMNTLSLLVLCIHLENKFGTLRTFVIAFLSAIGGGLFSAVLEDPCDIVVGASGVVFGMVGLFAVDFCLNFRKIQFPIMKAVLLLCFLITAAATSNLNHSWVSHLGGFLCGGIPGLLFFPSLKSERFEVFVLGFSALFVVLVFVVLPIIVTQVDLGQYECPDLLEEEDNGWYLT